MYEWLVNNKLTIYFGKGKTKCILSSKEKGLPEPNIKYDKNRIKQFHIVESLGCFLDANLSGESMTVKSYEKISAKL